MSAWLAHVQDQDKEAVRSYVARIQPIVSADARFKDVRLGHCVWDNILSPCMPIYGTVSAKEDWDAFSNLIVSSHPPVDPVFWSVHIKSKP